MILAAFPGQGSQTPGMGKDLVANFDAARDVFDEVSTTLGRDMRQLCWEADEDTLRQTNNAQIALFTCGVAAFRSLGRGDVFAGHSVGEFAALVASNTLSLADGARLVQRRGELMASAGSLRPGAMSAILGLEREPLESICREASSDGDAVVIANDNCPGQLVISGDAAAVERASATCKEQGAKLVAPLKVSGAFHSPLMLSSAEAFRPALQGVTFREALPVISNVLADVPPEPTWAHLLEQQLHSPVRWTESMQKAKSMGVSVMIEYGVGDVLCKLMKRIDRDLRSLPVLDFSTLEAVRAEL